MNNLASILLRSLAKDFALMADHMDKAVKVETPATPIKRAYKRKKDMSAVMKASWKKRKKASKAKAPKHNKKVTDLDTKTAA